MECPDTLEYYDEAWAHVERARKILWQAYGCARDARRKEDILGQMHILSTVAVVCAAWADRERHEISKMQKEREVI